MEDINEVTPSITFHQLGILVLDGNGSMLAKRMRFPSGNRRKKLIMSD
jgi:hypothetical protein